MTAHHARILSTKTVSVFCWKEFGCLAFTVWLAYWSKRSLSEREVLGSTPGPVRLDTVDNTAAAFDAFQCFLDAKPRRWAPLPRLYKRLKKFFASFVAQLP